MPRYLWPFLATVVLSGPAAPTRAATLCGILDGPGCVPTVCSVLDPRTCIADEDFPLGGDLRLTIDTQSAEAAPPPPDHDLNTLRDLFFMLRACWSPPALADARSGMQMTVRISFKRSGEMLSPPQLTYALPSASSKVRDVYRTAIGQSLSSCMPLHFTRGFGGAIAGHPIMIRYVDNRDLAQPQAR
jgi:hypothetical protein